MSAVAAPAMSVGPASGWGGLLRRRRRHPRQHGSRLWLIAVAVWVAVILGQIALSGAALRVCQGTSEALRQQVSLHI